MAAHFSFFILNMATMPMWMIEGMIFYALIVGLSVHYAKERLTVADVNGQVLQ